MKRREFMLKAAAATAGAFTAPYILPSGRLFARSGTRLANHVVFCLFAGGVRNIEAIQKSKGNLMRNMISGNETITSDIAPGIDPLPGPSGAALQTQGTLFKQFRYAEGPTGHYSGHTAAVTGTYTNYDLDIRTHPPRPTIFEYYRKHNSPQQTALNCWWVSNALGPYPALNYSNYPGYGYMYGANFIAPNYLISSDGNSVLGNPKSFSTADEERILKIRNFMDAGFKSTDLLGDPGIINNLDDNKDLQAYIGNALDNVSLGNYNNPWGVGSSMNGDMYNVFYAENILKQYKPELLVVNMQGVDVCHSEFTEYCNNLRKADYAVGHLWNTIQNTPGLANDTVLIVAPEHGRNLNGNSLVDRYGQKALDHTGDDVSRDIFCLIAGPPTAVKQNFVVNAVEGESIDIVPTIAHILGFDVDIPGGMVKDFTTCGTAQAFV